MNDYIEGDGFAIIQKPVNEALDKEDKSFLQDLRDTLTDTQKVLTLLAEEKQKQLLGMKDNIKDLTIMAMQAQTHSDLDNATKRIDPSLLQSKLNMIASLTAKLSGKK